MKFLAAEDERIERPYDPVDEFRLWLIGRDAAGTAGPANTVIRHTWSKRGSPTDGLGPWQKVRELFSDPLSADPWLRDRATQVATLLCDLDTGADLSANDRGHL